jgi:hypothetical protein
LFAFAFESARAAGNVLEYTYDAAGNVRQIQRQTGIGAPAIAAFSPASGSVGTSVMITGSGFDQTPSNNIVKFNGVSASVGASSSTSISTEVPPGATTGHITVTVGGATAISAQDFVVTIAGAPTITAFAPASGIAGDTVSVTGTGFDATPGATTIRLNGVAASTAVTSATALTFVVPVAAASAKLTATTAAGTGASVQDFIVPPSGVAASDIARAIRVSDGGPPVNLSIASANKSGLVLFDAVADGYYTIQFGQFAASPTSATIPYTLLKPDNTVLGTGSIGGTNRPTIHLPRLPADGTYSLLVSPALATLNANMKVGADTVLAVDGASAVLALDTPSQSGRIAFDAVAGQRIGIGVAGTALTPTNSNATWWDVYLPNGAQATVESVPGCYVASSANLQATCDGEMTASSTGRYTMIAKPPMGSAMSASVMLNGEVTGTLSPDAGVDVTLARVGQDARFTFAVNAGDSVAVNLSGVAAQPQTQEFPVKIYKPDGSYLTACSATSSASAYCELASVAQSGTYSIYIDPAYGAYGAFRLTVKQGAIIDTTAAATTVSTSTTGEVTRVRFAGTAGQNLTIGLAGLAYGGTSGSASYLNIYAPNGAQIGGPSCYPGTAGGSCKSSLANLPYTGTYSAALKPPANVTTTASLQLANEIVGALASGVTQGIDANRLGQNARFTFAGNVGDATSFKLLGLATVPPGQSIGVTLNKPNGAYLTSGTATAGNSFYLGLFALPLDGNYTVVLTPSYGATWQGNLLLDPGATMSIDGDAASLATLAAGDVLRFRWDGIAGQRVDFGVSGLSYAAGSSNGTYFSVYRPDGGSLTGATCYTSGAAACEASSASLPVTGTYIASFTPPAASSITGGTFAISTPVSGTLIIGDPAQPIVVSRPGQTARYVFSGTAAQALRLNWTGATVSSGAFVAISVVKPDGTNLSSGSFANGATGGLDIATLPAAGTYTVVFDPTTAATFSAPINLQTR